VKPWLLAIVRNCWLSRARDPKRKSTLGEDEAGLAEIASEMRGPEEVAIEASDNRRLKLIMALMPDEFRELLVLREIEDFSYQQIADTLSIPIGTVMSRLARARGMLREKWREGDAP
jgi:RNA polymerase sigma-70 factor (ECF subfamily)